MHRAVSQGWQPGKFPPSPHRCTRIMNPGRCAGPSSLTAPVFGLSAPAYLYSSTIGVTPPLSYFSLLHPRITTPPSLHSPPKNFTPLFTPHPFFPTTRYNSSRQIATLPSDDKTRGPMPLHAYPPSTREALQWRVSTLPHLWRGLSPLLTCLVK